MTELHDLETWCWSIKRRTVSNQELFSVSRALSGKKTVSRAELEQTLKKTLSLDAQRNQPEQKIAAEALQRFDLQAERALNNIVNNVHKKNLPAEGAGIKEKHSFSKTAQAQIFQEKNAEPLKLQKIAAAIISDVTKQFPALDRLSKAMKNGRNIKTVQQLFEYIKTVADELQKDYKNGGRKYYTTTKQGRGQLSFQEIGSDASAADQFKRVSRDLDLEALFAGIKTDETDQVITNNDNHVYFPDHSHASPLFETILELSKTRDLLADAIKTKRSSELNTDDMKSIIDQLIEFNMISQTFADTYLVNQERTAYFLAKEAFLKLSRHGVYKQRRVAGTHDHGRRGVASLQLDRVERSRMLTSRLAPMHSLRRGLVRRALYNSALLLDEEDLMDYESRKKVGYSIVIAVDVSGAVQFGKRIQGVRKACLAFAYYLKKHHSRDRVTYIAYHEVPREVSLVEVSRLKAINGAGKDIGGCLQYCWQRLKCDKERVPAVILIGDGLPVYGGRAGFYNFKENNREVIEKAYQAARLLRRNSVLFTFLQFQEDRYLWQDYADESARRIVLEAKGVLVRIKNPFTLAPSLIRAYHSLHND